MNKMLHFVWGLRSRRAERRGRHDGPRAYGEIYRVAMTILHKAGVAVVMTRTREPFRAIQVLRRLAFAENAAEFRTWSVLSGWEQYSRANPDQSPQADNVIDPIAALKAINSDPESGFPGGFYVMMYPHFFQKVPTFIAQVKEYANTLPSTRKRLILLTPPGTSMPPELEDDVTILDFEPPSHSELMTGFRDLIKDMKPERRPTISADDMDTLVSSTSGLSLNEAVTALSRAFAENAASLPKPNSGKVNDVLMKVKIETVRKTEILEIMPAEDMSNVGGLENLKEWVEKRKDAYTDEARAFGIDAPKGIVLAGPPGTGKSLTAKAIAHTMSLPLIKFDIGRVFGGLFGQSEQQMRATLNMIDSMSPCVPLIDEVDHV